jgi:hypothetical protein
MSKHFFIFLTKILFIFYRIYVIMSLERRVSSIIIRIIPAIVIIALLIFLVNLLAPIIVGIIILLIIIGGGYWVYQQVRSGTRQVNS